MELARVLKIDANEIRGDTGPILTQKDGYRGKDSTLYDELFDFYQVLLGACIAVGVAAELLALPSFRSSCRTHPHEPLFLRLVCDGKVPPALPLAPMAGVQAAKTPGGSGADAPRSFADKHGPLKKFAPPNRWQTRYFFVHGRKLRYYKDAAE